jgi:regulatory protein
VAERRPPDALETALRALRAYDRSAAELDARLEQCGVRADERAKALETLERIGYVDDARVAHTRASVLAERGSGDALIRHDLERRGIAPDLVAGALDELESERERAARIVRRRGPGAKTARYLASRGFGEEALEAAIAAQE